MSVAAVHLNGRIVGRDEALISAFDRGFLFGDAVYEGLRATGGRVIGLERHERRLAEGLAEARIGGFDPSALGPMTGELLRAAGLSDAFVYWQVSRGAPAPGAPVRERIPPGGMAPTVFGYASPDRAVEDITEPVALRAVTLEDTRWLRCRLKSNSLLGNVLGAIEAGEGGADDAIFVRGPVVAEATASNVFLRLGDRLVTPSLESAPMLAGVTRALILEEDRSIEARPVRREELAGADEVAIAGSRTMVAAVTVLDGRPVGDGRVGAGARSLLASLRRAIERDLHSCHG